MKIKFTKMHGLGNDFVVINNLTQSISLNLEQLRFIADRKLGIGCDQVLLVETARDPANDFAYRIFNADGGEVEQCGNGVRCFARFVHEAGLTQKTELRVETLGGIISPRFEPNGEISVNMGVPRTSPVDIPFLADSEALVYRVQVQGEEIHLSALSMGNPHAVLCVDDVAMAPVQTLGPLLQRHERFPARVNVGFMQIMDRAHIHLRVFERGVGETLACGTGACAAMVAGYRLGRLNDTVMVTLPGGNLRVDWQGDGEPVMMTGPATQVFEGEIEL